MNKGPEIVRVLSARKALADAKRDVEDASAEYAQALRAAFAAGHSYGELGRLLGITRQSVREYVERGKPS